LNFTRVTTSFDMGTLKLSQLSKWKKDWLKKSLDRKPAPIEMNHVNQPLNSLTTNLKPPSRFMQTHH